MHVSLQHKISTFKPDDDIINIETGRNHNKKTLITKGRAPGEPQGISQQTRSDKFNSRKRKIRPRVKTKNVP